MCAFMPAIANCSGAMPRCARFSNSGAHARPILRPAPSSSMASK